MQLLNRQLLLTGTHRPVYFHCQRRADPTLDLQVTTRLTANERYDFVVSVGNNGGIRHRPNQWQQWTCFLT